MVRMRWPYPPTPLIGRNLPSGYSEGERVFDERVKAQFPVGMSEALLVDQLRNQGFSVNTDHVESALRSATVTQGIVIKTLWSVRWYASADQIEDIWGVYGAIAP